MDYYLRIRQIDSALMHPEEIDVGSFLSEIKNDPDLLRYFFDKVSSTIFFDSLADWFIPDQTIEFEGGNPKFWVVLDYLERISEQVKKSPEYGEKLIRIIQDTIRFSIQKQQESGNGLNNIHIWWYFVKILRNIPLSIIKEHFPVEDLIDSGRIRYGFKTFFAMAVNFSGNLGVVDAGKDLLQKFLLEENMLPYAEAIVDSLTEIKPKEQRRSLSDREDAEFVCDEYWVQEIFRKQSALIGQKCSSTAILKIADKLKRALEYKQQNYYALFDVGPDVYRIMVSRVKDENAGVDQVVFRDYEYQCLVKKFSVAQLSLVDKSKDFWMLHRQEPEIDVLFFVFQAESADLFAQKVKEGLVPVGVDWGLDQDFEKNVRGLFKGLFSDYSQIWFKSLAGVDSDHMSRASEILTMVFRDVLLSKCATSQVDGKEILGQLLGRNYLFPIFKRFVLFCIDKHWAFYFSLAEVFFEQVPNVFNEADFEVELYDFLKNHSQEFSLALKDRLRTAINNVPQYFLDKGDEAIARWQNQFLSALKDDPDFTAQYQEVMKKLKAEKPFEPERKAFKGGFVVHKSPLDVPQILSLSIADLIKELHGFKGANEWDGMFEGKPDREGLADSLQEAVAKDPQRFVNNIDAFYGVPYFYVHHILRGIGKGWNVGKEFDQNAVLDFCYRYLSKESFIKEALEAQGNDSGEGRYLWIVEDVVDMIEHACQNDERKIDAVLFPKIEAIFDVVFPYLKGEAKPDTQRDALTYALNTTLGRVIMTYISFSLRMARDGHKSEGWGTQRFERYFEKGIEATIWFGRFFPNIRYLDKDYAENKLLYYEKITDDFEFEMFMDGYLKGADFYNEVFQIMRANYVKAIKRGDFGDREDNRLVQHIAVAYLRGLEQLAPKNTNGSDSLVWLLLDGVDEVEARDRWLEFAGFFWSVSPRERKREPDLEPPSPEVRERVLAFWKWAYENEKYVKDKLGDQYEAFLMKLGMLTIWLEKIDDVTVQWILRSAPYVDKDYRSGFFIEYLVKFEDRESIAYIGTVLEKVLEGSTPIYKNEEIILLVQRLYQNGHKESADRICNTYGRRGQYFLKELYYSYNPA